MAVTVLVSVEVAVPEGVFVVVFEAVSVKVKVTV